MVVFTCNHCGESLQKPKVEKHYFTTCRRAKKSLTCVDCLKDFLDVDYVAHTKCITEEERYAAKGSFSKAVVKKGQVKQESWTEVIQSVIENTSNAKPGQQQILTLLSSSTNVPRKKNKFVNFVKNALSRRISDRDIVEVWNVIEKYKEQQQQTTTIENKSEIVNENLKIENGNQENYAVDESAIETSKKRKKSKNTEVIKTSDEKNKDVMVNGNTIEENTKNEFNRTVELENQKMTENEVSIEPLKKRKKKSKNIEKNASGNVSGEDKNKSNVEVVNGTAVDISNQKKKSKVVQKNDVIKIIEDNINNDIILEGSKKKKRKSKNLNEDANIEIENSASKIEVEMEPSKKKKRKSENLTVNGTAQAQNGEELTVHGTAKNGKGKQQKLINACTENCKENEKEKMANNEETVLKESEGQQNSGASSTNFFYREKILEILKTNNNIPLKKLQKKVLRAYQEVTGTEPSEKVFKKFSKHLKKVNGIEIVENNVRLVDS